MFLPSIVTMSAHEQWWRTQLLILCSGCCMCMRTVYNVCGSRHVCAHRQRWRNVSVFFSGCYACARRQRWSACHTLAAITVSVHTYMGSGVEIISPQVLWRLSCPCTQRWRTCLILAAVTVSVHTYVGTGGEIISSLKLCGGCHVCAR